MQNVFNHETHRPSILDVVSEHVLLKRRGRQFWGLCPFHQEKTASFAVNEEKGVFHCYACHVGGDVITFVQQIERIDFKTAAKRLGLGTYHPSPEQRRVKQEVGQIISWARMVSRQVCDELREIGNEMHVCTLAQKQRGTDLILIADYQDDLSNRWDTLCALDDELNNSESVVELWRQRGDIEELVAAL